eukprot:SM000011S18968  [mRNA]  locus=s11:86475:87912:+ [translate_table: standard]
MGAVAFLGRVFFAAIFVLAAWQKTVDFGSDGGPALKGMEPKLEAFRGHITRLLNVQVPEVDVGSTPAHHPKLLLITAIVLEGLGGILFTLGSNLGALLLLLFLVAVTPIMHDFYNFEPTSQEFTQEFIQFLKNMSLFGALLFYLGLRNSAARSLARRKAGVKTKMT